MKAIADQIANGRVDKRDAIALEPARAGAKLQPDDRGYREYVRDIERRVHNKR